MDEPAGVRPQERHLDRDRDDTGRARNARPRDRLGRPLPRGADPGVEGVPESLDLEPGAAVALAQRYLDDELPFHAHEVFEALWKSRPAGERDLWQGLAQVAVGLTHVLRGNATGALALLGRGSQRLRGCPMGAAGSADRFGIDLPGVVRRVDALAADLRGRDPRDEPPPVSVRLQLR